MGSEDDLGGFGEGKRLGREIAWEGEGVEGGTWAEVGDGFGGVRWIGEKEGFG